MQNQSDLEAFLKSCLNYPSGDNCQPFQFRILSASAFEIYHHEARAKHRLNSIYTASLVSLGALLETIALNALAISHKMQIDSLILSETVGIQKWAEVSLHPQTQIFAENEMLLWKTLNSRCTDRSHFTTASLPKSIVNWMKAEAQNYGSLSFEFMDNLSPELTRLLLDNEEEAWKDSKLAKDVFKWIRFTWHSALKTKDGLTWKSLRLNPFQKPLLKIFSIFPICYQFFARLGATRENRKLLQSQIQNSGGFGWLAISSSDSQSVVQAGRFYFRLWLYLNSHGYGFQPLTLAMLPTYQFHLHRLPTDWPKRLKNLYPLVAARIQDDCSMSSNFIPILGFRTGLANPLPLDARCLRKNWSEVQF